MMDGNYNLRKVLAWVIAGVAVLLVVIWGYNYLTKGTIEVSTNNQKNYVKITEITSDKDKKAPSKEGQGNLSVKVKPGNYSVSVFGFNGSHGVNKTIAVKVRQKVSLKLDPPEIISAEPVYGHGVSGVSAGSDRLSFLDTDSFNLKSVNGTNVISTISPDVKFQSAQWDASGRGVAQLQTVDGALYSVRDQNASLIQLPFKPTNDKVVRYALSAEGRLYVSSGGDIYSGSLDSPSNLKKIYSGGGSVTKLFPNGDKLAAIELGQREGANSLLVLDGSGKVSRKNIDLSQAAWSPDGSYLTVNSQGKYIVLDASLDQSRVIVASNSSAIAWLDDNSFFYNIGGELWKYDIKESVSAKVTALGASNTINGIFLDNARSYIYLSATSNGKGSLLRVSTTGQAFSDFLISLKAFLPKDIGVCSLDYINFSGQPVITIRYPDSGTDPKLCVKSAKGDLRAYDLDPNKFNYVTVPYRVYY